MQSYQKANDLFVDEDYRGALDLYTRAIEEDSARADFFVKRSACHEKLGDNLKSAEDAERALQLDGSLVTAHFRKGVALFNLGEFEAARRFFASGLQLDPLHSQCKLWLRKCDAELDAERDDSTLTSTAVSSAPSPNPPSSASSASSSAPSLATPTSAPAPVRPAPVRHQWYQDARTITVEFYLKQRTRDDVSLRLTPHRMDLSVRLDGAPFEFGADLCGEINPDNSRFEVNKFKVEIVMAKAKQEQWDTLESGGGARPSVEELGGSAAKIEPPWSQKKKVDWNQLEAPEDKLDGEHALNKVFQDIFAKGSDDQKKAMMKSFTESGGTVLSTNWEDVGKKKVEIQPPSGMEVRKWNE